VPDEGLDLHEPTGADPMIAALLKAERAKWRPRLKNLQLQLENVLEDVREMSEALGPDDA
jgi:hypothetical protein